MLKCVYVCIQLHVTPPLFLHVDYSIHSLLYMYYTYIYAHLFFFEVLHHTDVFEFCLLLLHLFLSLNLLFA